MSRRSCLSASIRSNDRSHRHVRPASKAGDARKDTDPTELLDDSAHLALRLAGVVGLGILYRSIPASISCILFDWLTSNILIPSVSARLPNGPRGGVCRLTIVKAGLHQLLDDVALLGAANGAVTSAQLGSIAFGKGERPRQRSVHKRHLGYSQPSTVAEHRNTLCVSITPLIAHVKR
jgi:hypothetical protein